MFPNTFQHIPFSVTDVVVGIALRHEQDIGGAAAETRHPLPALSSAQAGIRTDGRTQGHIQKEKHQCVCRVFQCKGQGVRDAA